MVYKNYSDEELLLLLKNGNHWAYTEIYTRYWAVLFRHARKMLHDDDLASDIVQDLFTVIWIKKDFIDVKTNLSSYLYSSVRNKIITHINKSKIRDLHLHSLKAHIDQGVYSTDEWLNEKELAEIIEAEIELLPKKMRTVFQLSRKEHLSYKEIAEKLEITDHTVRKQISNVIKLIKNKLHTFIPFF